MMHTETTDLLTGAREIAAYLGWAPRTLRSHEAVMPVFRIGRTLCARKSSLEAWLADREIAALMPAEPARAA